MNTITRETARSENNNNHGDTLPVFEMTDRLPIDYVLTENWKQAVKEIPHYKSGKVLLVNFHDEQIQDVETGVVTIMRLFTAMGHVLQQRTEKSFIEQMVNMAIPTLVPSPHAIKEAAMTIKARERVLASGDLLTAADIAKLAGFSEKNPSVQPNRWKKAGAIFAIQHRGADYYPSYALDPQNGYRPRPAMAEIIQLFGKKKGDWGKAYWFASVNSFLGGKRPQDVLATDPERVIAAAANEMEGVVHG